MLDLNKRALQIVKSMLEDEDLYAIKTKRMTEQLTLVDLGIESLGSWLAGKKLVEIMTGGLGEVCLEQAPLRNYRLPSIDVYLDQPGVTINGHAPFYADNEIWFFSSYFGASNILADDRKNSVLYVQGLNLTEKRILKIGEDFRVKQCLDSLYILAAPANSLVAAIYSASLGVSNTIKVMIKNGFSPVKILWAWGSGIVLPIADQPWKSWQRISCAAQYGSSCSVWVRSQDTEIEEVLTKVDCVAMVCVHNLATAKTFVKGALDFDALEEQLKA